MAKKRVTRKKVNDSTINNVFRDIYDRIDDLQPQSSETNSKNSPSIGDTAVVTTDANITSMAAYTDQGWMIDINSNFRPVSSRHGFIASEGIHGKSRTPVHGEAVKYNKDHTLPIGNHKKEKVLLKNIGGILTARNANDSADADIRCASIKDANGKKVIDIDGASSAVNFIKNTNSATTNNPVIAPDGEDNIGITLTSKGTGDVALQTSSGNSYIQFLNSSGALKGQISTLSTPAFNLYGAAADQALLDCDTNALTRLWNHTDGTAAHLQISAADYLYLAGSDGIYLYGGGTGQSGGSGTFDMGSYFATFKGGGGSILQHTATATSTGFEIDTNISGDDASNGTGLNIDFIRGIASSGTAAHNDRGIDIDMFSPSLGTSSVTGIDIDVAGTASGTSTATGIDLSVTAADTNIGMIINTGGTHLKLTAAADPSNDYGTIAVADTGDMTIATVGNGTTDSDLTLDVDGGITLDAANGHFIMKGPGTTSEFSVANSAYAGMILGYRLIGEDTTHVSYTLTTGYVVPNAAMTVRFIAPPSGNVEVFVQVFHNSSTSNRSLYLGLSDAATYNTIGVQYEQIARYPDETDDDLISHRWGITGLTPGDTYNYWLGAKTSFATAYLNWGGDASGRYPDFIMKVTALPAATSDFAVYD